MSAGLTESNALMSGVARYESGQQRAQLFDANKQIAERQAQSEAEAGAFNEETVRMKGAALTGQQEAQIGASGLQSKGTPAAVVAGTRMITELNALQTRNNALRRAWGFRVQGASDVVQAEMAQRAGIQGGLGSILSGSSEAARAYQQTGSFF